MHFYPFLCYVLCFIYVFMNWLCRQDVFALSSSVQLMQCGDLGQEWDFGKLCLTFGQSSHSESLLGELVDVISCHAWAEFTWACIHNFLVVSAGWYKGAIGDWAMTTNCYVSQQTYIEVNDTYSEGGTHEETLRPQSKAKVMNKRWGDKVTIRQIADS